MFGENERIGNIVEAATAPHLTTPIRYDKSKPAFAREICELMTQSI